MLRALPSRRRPKRVHLAPTVTMQTELKWVNPMRGPPDILAPSAQEIPP